ncbi:MAG: nucleotidyltransferase domain-containing protein [Bacteroidota bacterium]
MKKAVANKEELLSRLYKNGERIHGYGIKTLNLFGSFKRNTDIHQKSDVDFLIEFQDGQETFRNIADLGYFLEDLLGRKVELITKESLSPFFAPHILNDAEYVGLIQTE